MGCSLWEGSGVRTQHDTVKGGEAEAERVASFLCAALEPCVNSTSENRAQEEPGPLAGKRNDSVLQRQASQ